MSDDGWSAPRPNAEELFNLGGGRVSRGLERLRLAGGNRLRAGRIALLSTSLTWLPLLILSAVEGGAWGDRSQVPFLRDFLPYGQFLIAVPILILGEWTVGRFLVRAAAGLQSPEILEQKDRPVLDDILGSLSRHWRGQIANTVLIALTFGATAVSLLGARDWLTGGWQVSGDSMTLAGWWYLLISLPVMRYLALRWLWRLLLWQWVLWRVSRLELNPRPAHPDRAGGLAFLGAAQAGFGVLVFAFGVQLSCLIADAVHFLDADLTTFVGELVAYVLIAVLVLLVPLLVFVPRLVQAREGELLFLSERAHLGAGDLYRKLGANETGELPVDAVSGLSDFGALYENARRMRPVPLETQHIVAMVLAAVVPFIPLIFLVMPAREVLQTLAKLLV